MGYEGALVLEFLARTHQTSLLTEREKHLIGLAVTMTRGCQVCTRGRIEKARVARIEDEVLNALAGIVSAVNAGVAAATMREAFRNSELSPPAECGPLCAVTPPSAPPDLFSATGSRYSGGCTRRRYRSAQVLCNPS